MKIASTFLELLGVSPRVPCAEDMGKFFGDDHDEEEKYNTADALEATKVCFDCPLRFECLQDALETNEQYGVRGGTTPAQRQFIKSRGW